MDVNVAERRYVEFQCNDLVIDMRDRAPIPEAGYPHIDGLLNPIMRVEANKDTRAFLFVDALGISAEV